MTRAELIESIAKKNQHLPQTDIVLIVRTMLDCMAQHLASDDRIEIRGFGSFSLNRRPTRKGRNPKIGEAVQVPEKRVPNFKSGKELRERVDK